MEKIILTTGGTGGHIFPAIATAEEVRRRNPHADILFIGSQYGIERDIASKNNLKFCGLPVRGLMGRGIKAIPAGLSLLKSIFAIRKVLKQFHPDCIAGFGGYASFAALAAAKTLNIPIILHEQNAIAGAVNKLMARYARTVCVSMPGTKGFPDKTVFTGNPIRAAFKVRGVARNFSEKRLLILGGSQGARGLNQQICKIAPRLKEAGIEILHQTGPKDYEKVREEYEKAGLPQDWATPFIEYMQKAYGWASLALSRAGASAIAELCATGTPSVLTPFPAAIHDHQTINAKVLAENGAALLEQERDLNEEKLFEILRDLLDDPVKLQEMSRNAFTLGQPEAAGLLVDEMEKIV